MIITITPGHHKREVLLVSHDLKLRDFPGAEPGGTTKRPYITIRTATNNLLSTMLTITSWINNKLDEECLFEID